MTDDHFKHGVGDLVLVKWQDERIYFAKIRSVSESRRVCGIVFEDGEEASVQFADVYSVDSSADECIVCIVCKFGTSDAPNEIVLCDKCGIAYHQRCHSPNIPDSALELTSPWECRYCQLSCDNPHVKRPGRERKPFTAPTRKKIRKALAWHSKPSMSHRTPKRDLPASHRQRHEHYAPKPELLAGKRKRRPMSKEGKRKPVKEDFPVGQRSRTLPRRWESEDLLKKHQPFSFALDLNSEVADSNVVLQESNSNVEVRTQRQRVEMKAQTTTAPVKEPSSKEECSADFPFPSAAVSLIECGRLSNELVEDTCHALDGSIGITCKAAFPGKAVEDPPRTVDSKHNYLNKDGWQTADITRSMAHQPKLVFPHVQSPERKLRTESSRWSLCTSSKSPVFLQRPDSDLKQSVSRTVSADMVTLVAAFNREHDTFMVGLSNKDNRDAFSRWNNDRHQIHNHLHGLGPQKPIRRYTCTNSRTIRDGQRPERCHGLFQQTPASHNPVTRSTCKSKAEVQFEARQIFSSHEWRLLQKKALMQPGAECLPAKARSQEKNPSHVCVSCGKYADYLCAVCQEKWYCSHRCQARTYLIHCFKCTHGSSSQNPSHCTGLNGTTDRSCADYDASYLPIDSFTTQYYH